MKNAFQIIANLPGVLRSVLPGLRSAVSILTRIDAIDLGVALIGVGVWLIHPPAAVITFGVILLTLGLVHRPGRGR